MTLVSAGTFEAARCDDLGGGRADTTFGFVEDSGLAGERPSSATPEPRLPRRGRSEETTGVIREASLRRRVSF
jgi:hypothetical protein